MKYKEGDKVRVRGDLHHGQYGADSVVEDMILLKGKIVTIGECYITKYKIRENHFNWTDEMFSGLAEDEEVPVNEKVLYSVSFKKGEKTLIRKKGVKI